MKKSSKLKQEFTNLPNLLTYGRIALIPLVVWLIVNDSPMNCFWAAIVYSLASLTDMLDGWLARVSNQVSMVGKFLDPLADKLIVTIILITLVPLGRIPPWVVCVIIARELSVTGLRAVAAGEGLIIAASDTAKTKTAFQLIAIVGLLIHYRYPLDLFGLHLSVNYHTMGLTMTYISLVFSLYSGVLYFRGFVRAILARETA